MTTTSPHGSGTLKRQEVLGGYDPSRYEAKRLWAVARDGTKVPISVVHRKGVALDGGAAAPLRLRLAAPPAPRPFVESSEPARSRRRVRQRHIRGGGEMGEDWREQGRMMKKLNTFNDFIDCAEYW